MGGIFRAVPGTSAARQQRGADALVRGCPMDAPVRRFAGRGVRRTNADEGVRATLEITCAPFSPMLFHGETLLRMTGFF